MVEVTVFAAMVEVGAPREVMSVEAVWALHKTWAAPFGEDAAVVGSLHRDGAVTVQPMMDVDAPLGVVHIAHTTIGAGANHASIRGVVFSRASGWGVSKARRPRIVTKAMTGCSQLWAMVSASGHLRSVGGATGGRTTIVWMVGGRLIVVRMVGRGPASARIVCGWAVVRVIGGGTAGAGLFADGPLYG